MEERVTSPLLTNTPKLRLVVRITLDAQAGREDELADCGAEAGEEGVEGLFFLRKSLVSSAQLGAAEWREDGLGPRHVDV